MKTKELVIYEDNIRCRECLSKIILALSQIKEILFLDINMKSKIIKIKYQDEVLDNNDIKILINHAVLV